MEKKYYFFHVCEMWPEAKKKDGGREEREKTELFQEKYLKY